MSAVSLACGAFTPQRCWRAPAIRLLVVATLWGASCAARGEEYKEYGKYNLRNAPGVKASGAGKQGYRVDEKLIDRVVDDLAEHAKDYPPKFRGREEQTRAERDAKALVAVFDTLTADKNASTPLLL